MGIDFLTRGISPWGQSIFTHISWDMLWVSFFAGVVFLAAHSVYMLLSAHTKRPAAEVDALEARLPALPSPHPAARPRRAHVPLDHGGVDVHAALHVVPADRRACKFAWVQWHWIAGLVLTASILFHIVHATFVLDFWSIWVGPKDIPEFKSEMMRELGLRDRRPEAGQVPARQPALSPGHRRDRAARHRRPALFMMKKVQTPFLTRDPYILTDTTWGWMYVGHGVAGVALVGLTMAHVYFAIRPEKFWITKSMLFGDHHAPRVPRTPRSGALARAGLRAGRRPSVGIAAARCASRWSLGATTSKKPTSSCSPTPPRAWRATPDRTPGRRCGSSCRASTPH